MYEMRLCLYTVRELLFPISFYELFLHLFACTNFFPTVFRQVPVKLGKLNTMTTLREPQDKSSHNFTPLADFLLVQVEFATSPTFLSR